MTGMLGVESVSALSDLSETVEHISGVTFVQALAGLGAHGVANSLGGSLLSVSSQGASFAPALAMDRRDQTRLAR